MTTLVTVFITTFVTTSKGLLGFPIYSFPKETQLPTSILDVADRPVILNKVLKLTR